MMSELISVAEAAAELGVHPRQVRNLIAHGQLAAQRVGHLWLIPSDAVDARRRSEALPGRPLSAQSAWWILARIDAALDGEPPSSYSPADRRARHRLREQQLAHPTVPAWGSWLRRRGEPKRVWFHPGASKRIAADRRVARHDFGDQLGLDLSGVGRLYVGERDFSAIVDAHHGRQVSGAVVGGEVLMMVVPELLEELDWRSHVRAAALVDLLDDPDARVQHAAQEALGGVAAALQRDAVRP